MKKLAFITLFLTSISIFSESFPIIEHKGTKEKAIIHKLNISIDITGNIAETTLDITYFNPNDTKMTGTLKPLSIGIKKLNQTLIDQSGLLVNIKNKELNNTTLHLEAWGYKRVVYKLYNFMAKSKNRYVYNLPFTSEISITDFSLTARQFKEGDIENTSQDIDGYKKWKTVTLLDYNTKNYLLRRPLKFKIPAKDFNKWYSGEHFFVKTEVYCNPENVKASGVGVTELFTKILKSGELVIVGRLNGNSSQLNIEYMYKDGEKTSEVLTLVKSQENSSLDLDKLWEFLKG